MINPIFAGFVFAGLVWLHIEGNKSRKRFNQHMERRALLQRNLTFIYSCIFSCKTYEQLTICVQLINERVLPHNPEMVPDLFDYIEMKEMQIIKADKEARDKFFQKLHLGTIPKSWVN